MNYKKMNRLSMLLALSIVLGLLESFLPVIGGSIPGMKLGLANAVVLAVLYQYGVKDACYISFMRVLLLGFLRTGLFSTTFFFSLGGAFVSLLIMILLKPTKLSIYGISVLGAIGHSVGQIIMASFLLQHQVFFYYLPWLCLFSIVTGILVAWFGKQIINILEIQK